MDARPIAIAAAAVVAAAGLAAGGAISAVALGRHAPTVDRHLVGPTPTRQSYGRPH